MLLLVDRWRFKNIPFSTLPVHRIRCKSARKIRKKRPLSKQIYKLWSLQLNSSPLFITQRCTHRSLLNLNTKRSATTEREKINSKLHSLVQYSFCVTWREYQKRLLLKKPDKNTFIFFVIYIHSIRLYIETVRDISFIFYSLWFDRNPLLTLSRFRGKKCGYVIVHPFHPHCLLIRMQ